MLTLLAWAALMWQPCQPPGHPAAQEEGQVCEGSGAHTPRPLRRLLCINVLLTSPLPCPRLLKHLSVWGNS